MLPPPPGAVVVDNGAIVTGTSRAPSVHGRARVPFVDLGPQNRVVMGAVRAGWDATVARSSFVMGAEAAAFEREFADFCGAEFCVGLASGTDALEIALRSVGIGPGDEVVVPAFSFVASATAVVRAGAQPVFCDIDPTTYLIDPGAAEAVVSERTAAICAVHLYGQMAPMAELADLCRRRGLHLVEDAAQAQGATQHGAGVGRWSAAAATSFYPSKNLGAFGDAGALVTNDADIARRARRIRNHGGEHRYEHACFGFNSRLDDLQAVVLRAKLPRLRQWNADRAEAAARYLELLECLPAAGRPVVAPGNEHVYHLYVVPVAGRSALQAAMKSRGVETGVHYPEALPRLPVFSELGYRVGQFPRAEAAAAQVLSLPMFPGISEAQQRAVAVALAEAWGSDR